MLNYCYRKWYKNRGILEDRLKRADLQHATYEDLLKMTVECIFNNERSCFDPEWDAENITEIDNGEYQGTLLYIIPEKTYQPSEYQYLMTYIGYGSCPGCDLLQSIQPCDMSDVTDKTIKYFMSVCRDFVTNMVKPYNHGWRQSDDFEQMIMED